MNRDLTSSAAALGGRRPSLQDRRGVALILTLAILALVTLLLIAFVTSMRVENVASKNFNEVVRTRELARGAIDQAVAQIRQATPLRTDGNPSFYYVTGPGVIFTNKNGTYGPVYLFPGGANVVPTDTINSTNLNAGFWITGQDGVYFSVDANSQINVGWTYVAADGSTGSSPLPSGKPIIGRYTYWVDDESAKINLNTANGPSAVTADPLSLGASTNVQVDLSMLLGGLKTAAGSIPTRQAPSGPGYTTIEEVKIPDGSTTAATDFTNNQFYLTAHSDDAYYPTYLNTQGDLDVFERQRLLVSALASPGDIDGSAGRNTSALGRLSDTALKTVYSSSGTFLDKYGLTGLEQLIANIIAYQHDPQNPADANPFPYDPAPGSDPPPYLGLAKVPYVNEVQIKYTATVDPVSGALTMFSRTVTVELYYLYGADSVNGYVSPGETLVVKNLPLIAIPGVTIPTTVTVIVPPNTTFGTRANAYQTFANSGTYTPTPGTLAPVAVPAVGPSGSAIIIDYLSRGGNRMDCAVVPPMSTFNINASGTYYQGAEVNDPCLNESIGQWTIYPNSAYVGTLLRPNSVYVPPPQDGGIFDSKAHIRGSAMLSVGELGYIHLPPGAANAWKHLKLQPGGGATAGQIPDWAILDLFTAGSATAGRININSYVWPGFPNANVRRTVPLLALLSSAFGTGASAPANQIYDDNSARIDSYGMQGPGGPREGVFDTIGEVCEMPLLANGATTEAGKEAAIRSLANVITVRGNTFTVWVLAQSIKQPPNTPSPGTFTPGVDVITGDVRAQAVVERYETTPGSSNPQFRTRYFRYLYN